MLCSKFGRFEAMAKKKRPTLEATGGLAVGEATSSVTLVAVLLLVMSGTAGLVYQLLWVKQLSLVVGADVFAVTTAVSAFSRAWPLPVMALANVRIALSARFVFTLSWKLALASWAYWRLC